MNPSLLPMFRERMRELPVDASEERSRVCANYINAYWHARGFDMHARVIASAREKNGALVYSIISNSLNGLPLVKI